MIVIDRIILLLILFGGVVFFWLSLRARRELHQLRRMILTADSGVV